MRCLQTTDGKQLEGGGQREKQRALPKSCLLKVLEKQLKKMLQGSKTRLSLVQLATLIKMKRERRAMLCGDGQNRVFVAVNAGLSNTGVAGRLPVEAPLAPLGELQLLSEESLLGVRGGFVRPWSGLWVMLGGFWRQGGGPSKRWEADGVEEVLLGGGGGEQRGSVPADRSCLCCGSAWGSNFNIFHPEECVACTCSSSIGFYPVTSECNNLHLAETHFPGKNGILIGRRAGDGSLSSVGNLALREGAEHPAQLLYLTKDKFCHFEDLVGGANDDYLDARFKSGSLYYFKGLTKSSKTCYCLEKGLLARKHTNTGFKVGRVRTGCSSKVCWTRRDVQPLPHRGSRGSSSPYVGVRTGSQSRTVDVPRSAEGCTGCQGPNERWWCLYEVRPRRSALSACLQCSVPQMDDWEYDFCNVTYHFEMGPEKFGNQDSHSREATGATCYSTLPRSASIGPQAAVICDLMQANFTAGTRSSSLIESVSHLGINAEELSSSPVTTLVNTSNKGPSGKKKGRSKKAHVLAASVEQATQNFLEKGDQIAKESQDLKEELVAAVEDVRKQGETMRIASSEFADDPCSSVKRGTMVRAARALLSAVTRLLILADMADVMRLLSHLKIVEEALEAVKNATNEQDLANRFKEFGKEMVKLNYVAARRQQELKDPHCRDEMAAARGALKKNATMLYTASQAFLRHPDVAATRANRDYVFKQVQEAIAGISNAAQATSPTDENKGHTGIGELAAALNEFDCQKEADCEFWVAVEYPRQFWKAVDKTPCLPFRNRNAFQLRSFLIVCLHYIIRSCHSRRAEKQRFDFSWEAAIGKEKRCSSWTVEISQAFIVKGGGRFYEKLDLDDLKSPLFSDLAIKQRVKKCDLSDLQNLNLPQTQLPAEQPGGCDEHQALTASSRIQWSLEREEDLMNDLEPWLDICGVKPFADLDELQQNCSGCGVNRGIRWCFEDKNPQTQKKLQAFDYQQWRFDLVLTLRTENKFPFAECEKIHVGTSISQKITLAVKQLQLQLMTSNDEGVRQAV
ncbi:Catenin alpha-2 [Anas platyrhynchos]|uniref:Catenin alpha-2 n=5 Tax=Sauria TaxID=32561 RepID=R0M272_ANAPL|nr:Catenin alpha-2 [Anas platyrhynchos]